MPQVILDPLGFFRRVPLMPHQLVDRTTRTEDTIVLCHLGVPKLAADAWTLAIDGLVAQPLSLSFDDLLRQPKTKLTTIHQCAGSPLQPEVPTRRICNVTWTGTLLAGLLDACGVESAARYVWSYGADYGSFDGIRCDTYVKDLPIERANHDVLLAYELNGAPLRPENGYPVRLVVPGFYGTNSVKWITRIELANRRVDSPFTTRWYNDAIKDEAGTPTGETTPVWSIAPESVIVNPAPSQVLEVGREFGVWGWAWGDGGVRSVELSFDDGDSWGAAELEAATGYSWQRYRASWRPQAAGPVTVLSRATGLNGRIQPDTGARNARHRVLVTAR